MDYNRTPRFFPAFFTRFICLIHLKFAALVCCVSRGLKVSIIISDLYHALNTSLIDYNLHLLSLQSPAGKSGQNETRTVDLLVVIFAQLLLFLGTPTTHRFFEVPLGILTTDHEADLTRRVGGDGGVGVLDHGKNLAAGPLEAGDERQVEPDVFGCRDTNERKIC